MGFERLGRILTKSKIPDTPICFRSAAMLLAYIMLTAPPVVWFLWHCGQEALHQGLLE